MNKTLLFKKIKSVSFKQLIKIIFYKLQYKLFVTLEKRRNKENNIFKEQFLVSTNSVSLFQTYFEHISNNKLVILEADQIIENKIKIFERDFIIEESDWLKDSLTGKMWDATVFFTDAKVEESGYGDVKYVMELNKMGFIVTLAQAYYMNSNEKYIEKIETYLKAWKDCVPYMKSVVNKSMLDIAFRAINLIHISLLCCRSELFQKKVFPLILSIIYFSEQQIRKFSTPRWCKYSSGANHTIGEMIGLLVIQMFLKQFTLKNYERFYSKQFYYLYRSLKNIITKEGVYLEQSAHYSKLVAEFLIILDIFIKDIPDKKAKQFYKDSYLKKILHYLQVLSFNNHLPNFGDNDGAKVLLPFYEKNYSVSHILKYYSFLDGYKISHTLLCKESGQFIWKSNDDTNLYVFIRSGKHSFLPIGSGSHAHNDILSLILSIQGEELFIDQGTYFYNSGLDIINSNRSTANHNTISIGKTEQAAFAAKWMYATYPESELITENIKTFPSSFTFSGKCLYNNIEHIRHIIFENKRMLIIDNINNTTNDAVSINFLLSPFIQIQKISEWSFDLYREKNKWATILFEDSIDVNVQEVYYYPSYGIKKKTSRIYGISKIFGKQTIKTIIMIHNYPKL